MVEEIRALGVEVIFADLLSPSAILKDGKGGA
jgi:hypothetical protein